MYPLYWTNSKEGIIMRYSYEFKRKCVELYYQGKYPDTPEGIEQNRFRRMVRDWVRKYKIYGYNGLIPKQKSRKSKNPDMKNVDTKKPPKLNESECEELIRLRDEIKYMKAEVEVIKKRLP